MRAVAKSRGVQIQRDSHIHSRGPSGPEKGQQFEVPGGGFIVIQRVRDIFGGKFDSKVQRPAANTSNQFGCAENGS